MKRLTIVLLALGVLFFSCQPESSNRLTDFVNPFIGTGGHGHTYPGATVPFGMVQLSPDTRLEGWDGCGGYHFTDSIIYGFSHTHLSGTGVSDYGDILFMPQPSTPYKGKVANIPDVIFNNGYNGKPGYNSMFKKSSEKATAGYYSVHLDKPDVEVELTTTERAGFQKYTYKNLKGENNLGTIILDLTHRDMTMDAGIRMVNLSEIEGYRVSNAWATNQRVYFVAQFSEPIIGYSVDSFQVAIKPEMFKNKHLKSAFHFELPGSGELKVRVGISAVDIEGARKNLEAEITDWDFEKTKNAASEKWEKQLSKIEVDALNDDEKTIFYTSLYHTSVVPNIFTDVDRRYRGHDDEIHTAANHNQYTVFSLWDTYRAANPLYTIIEPKRTNDFINSFLEIYKNDGRLPIWELWNNRTNCMVGYHAVSVIADAYRKGIRGFDQELALEAMIKFSNENEYGKWAYAEDGFLSSEKESESVSKTLEYAYNDWCIAQMAKELGKDSTYKIYSRRAQSWKNIFDPESKFFRAKNRGFWVPNFDPFEVNFHLTEANSWQYGFYVPHDLETFIEYHGGEEAFDKRLDELFSAETETSGRHQADITGLIGQYAHGNEPSHHIAYLYNYVQKPWKAQAMLHRIMTEMYTNKPHGLEGNEDCGQMSAWYVMSALGIYPVLPGEPIYDIGSPRVKSATINLENGETFTIKAPKLSKKNIYVQSVSLNGADIGNWKISHEDIMKGGELVFKMRHTPNEKPGSYLEENTVLDENLIVPVPAVSAGERVFMNRTKIELNHPLPDAEIFYGLDGKTPTIKYEKPISINRTTTLTAFAKTDFGERVPKKSESQKIKVELFKIPKNRSIKIATKYANQYAAGGDKALIDFIKGGPDFRTGEWQGYEGVNLDATINMSNDTAQRISINFLQDENAWIFMPTSVEFYGSNDGRNFKLLRRINSKTIWTDKNPIIEKFTTRLPDYHRYLRVVGVNRNDCPEGHKSESGTCWVFADEITIE